MKCPKCGGDTCVLETRMFDNDGVVFRRRRQCERCANRFNTFEVYENLKGSIAKQFTAHIGGVKKRRRLTLRNEKIVERLKQGEKVVVIAHDFGLSESMVSTIARNNGLPPLRTGKRSKKPDDQVVS